MGTIISLTTQPSRYSRASRNAYPVYTDYPQKQQKTPVIPEHPETLIPSILIIPQNNKKTPVTPDPGREGLEGQFMSSRGSTIIHTTHGQDTTKVFSSYVVISAYEVRKSDIIISH